MLLANKLLLVLDLVERDPLVLPLRRPRMLPVPRNVRQLDARLAREVPVLADGFPLVVG